jgi:hypothetical protein
MEDDQWPHLQLQPPTSLLTVIAMAESIPFVIFKRICLIVSFISTALSDDVLSSSSHHDGLRSAEASMLTNGSVVDNVTSVVDVDGGMSAERNKTLDSEGVKHESAAKSDSDNNRYRYTPNYDDEQTYLDLFGERAKELLTQHIIPATDANCRWDWRMGRCEPFCQCGYFFLWGDYHLGRSCRLRSKFTPVQSSGETKTSSDSLQDAWQQWADHMDDPDAFASFVDSGNRAKQSQNDLQECSLPSESRYTQAVYYFTKLLEHGTIVLHQSQKVKQQAAKLASGALTHGKNKFNDGRENACKGLKSMIEAREQERNQPVVLTRRGMVWIRRLCGKNTGNDTTDGFVDDSAEDLQDVIADDYNDNEST